MQPNQHPFQKWMEDNGVADVRFYPGNPSESAATDLLNSAMNAVNLYENGECSPYEDATTETYI